MRPRFAMRVDLEGDAVMAAFESRKERGDLPFVVHLYERQVEIGIRSDERHAWSPFLNLLVETAENGTTLNGKYGPAVNLWTLFLAGYAVATIVGGVGLVLGYSQSMLDQEPTGYGLAVAAAMMLVVVHVAGRIGRWFAHPQMLQIHEHIEAMFGEHILELHDEEADRD